MPPVLHTPRLLLRPPSWADLAESHRIASDPLVMRYIRQDASGQDWKESQQELKTRISANALPLGYWVLDLQPSRAFAGWITLRHLYPTKSIEIGFRLGQEYWGTGLATEAARRVLWYGFWELGLPKICAVAVPENTASLRVLEKAGLRLEGYGEYYDMRCVRMAVNKQGFIKQYRGF